MLIASIFYFSYNVFYSIKNKFEYLSHILSSANGLQIVKA